MLPSEYGQNKEEMKEKMMACCKLHKIIPWRRASIFFSSYYRKCPLYGDKTAIKK